MSIVATPNAIERVIQDTSVGPLMADALLNSFSAPFADSQAIIEKSRAIVVTDATQVTLIKQAREARLKLKDIRVEANKVRETLKAESLRTGKAIDGIYNVLKLQIEPEEERLEKQEKFAELAEKARIAKMVAERTERLRPLEVDAANYNLAGMSDADFDRLVTGLHKERSDRLEQQRLQAEAEAKRREEEAAERARLAEQNRILREQAEKAQAEQRRIQAEANAKLAAERKAREQAEAEAQAARDTEARRQALAAADAKKEAAAKARARRAPDRDKIATLAQTIRDLPLPPLSEEASQASKRIAKVLDQAANEIAAIASEL